MPLLVSNNQPVKTKLNSFPKVFSNLLNSSSRVDIATGYISEKSVDFLSEFILKNGKPILNLTIGMHYFEKFTQPQYAAAKELEDFLTSHSLGSVKLVTSFPFHGKLYSFTRPSSEPVCLMGSSNLDNILIKKPKICYETDLLINDKNTVQDIRSVIQKIYNDAAVELGSLEINEFKHTNSLLEGLSSVQEVEETELAKIKASINPNQEILLPLKPYEKAGKSNLHPYLGKGRENKSTGITLPRSWYEVELIVPKRILDKKIFPEKGETIHIITDDGYKFNCKTSGTNGKNLRSTNDLKTLGKWIKGRIQNSGAVQIGEKITAQTLQDYGRNNISIYPTRNSNEWFFDFNINKV